MTATDGTVGTEIARSVWCDRYSIIIYSLINIFEKVLHFFPFLLLYSYFILKKI